MLKSLPAQITAITAAVRPARLTRNIKFLGFFSVALVLLTLLFTTLFHVIMESEKQDHSWASGLYWTLVTMSTLGFGDITFKSDIGRLFSVVVLLSGMIFLLVLLPFTFIEFFYSPFVKAQQEARAPRPWIRRYATGQNCRSNEPGRRSRRCAGPVPRPIARRAA